MGLRPAARAIPWMAICSRVMGNSQASHVSPLPGPPKTRGTLFCGRRPSWSLWAMRMCRASSSMAAASRVSRLAQKARFTRAPEWPRCRQATLRQPGPRGLVGPEEGCPSYGARLGAVAKPEPEKKRQPSASAARRILPMQLRTGDRITDETGEWEIIARPYTTAGDKNARVRVQRVGDPTATELRTWAGTSAST